MRSQGISPRHIADTLNAEKIMIPSDYYYAKLGKPNPRHTSHLWCAERVRVLTQNPTYLGHLVQLRTTTVSYKNHKVSLSMIPFHFRFSAMILEIITCKYL